MTDWRIIVAVDASTNEINPLVSIMFISTALHAREYTYGGKQ